MTEKKMTTGGFFRGLLRRAIHGDKVPNPLETVAKAMMKEGSNDGKETLETTGEAQEDRNPKHERASS